MEPKLREYIENLFAAAPKTNQANELKEEIVRNTIERYHDLISEGKTENEAFNLAIAGVGDINELIEELGGESIEEQVCSKEQLEAAVSRMSVFKGIAVALYILCVTPCIFLSVTPLVDISPVFMFYMISVATGLLVYGKCTKFVIIEENRNPAKAKKIKIRALMKAIAIGMYISCPTPCILLASTPIVAISPTFLFLMIAVATILIILSRNKEPGAKEDRISAKNYIQNNIPKKKTSALYKILVALLWVSVSFAYIAITFFFGAAVSWIIFPAAAAVQNLMRAIFDYAEAEK